MVSKKKTSRNKFLLFSSNNYCIEIFLLLIFFIVGNVKKIYKDRLALCEITADVMAACFNVLGIRTVDRM